MSYFNRITEYYWVKYEAGTSILRQYRADNTRLNSNFINKFNTNTVPDNKFNLHFAIKYIKQEHGYNINGYISDLVLIIQATLWGFDVSFITKAMNILSISIFKTRKK